MVKKNDQLIGEILLDQLPKNIREALRVMASLTYPISDQRSFVDQLETLGKDQEKSPSAEQVEAFDFARGMFTARDFPILTPVSGLEKTFAYFSKPFWEDFGPDLYYPDPRDSFELPPLDPYEAFKTLFCGPCADHAYQYYWELRDPPHRVDHLNAFWLATIEGNKCVASGGCFRLPSGASTGPRLVDPSEALLEWARRLRSRRPPR